MGLGNIGLPVIQHVSKIYSQTHGYDVSTKAVNAVEKLGINASTELVCADSYVIAVNTWYRNNYLDMSIIEDCTKHDSKLCPKALVCFESTLAKSDVCEFDLKHNLYKFTHKKLSSTSETLYIEKCNKTHNT
jgi:UDP-N-acetyl-D-mannosaminuronate dehydrogenase